MSTRSRRRKPEDWLLRIIQVAEILARGEENVPTASEGERHVPSMETAQDDVDTCAKNTDSAF